MTDHNRPQLRDLLEILGIAEEPVGIYYTPHKPTQGLAPKPMDLPTVEREAKNEIDWQATFADFSCIMGHIWRARLKNTPVYASAEQWGCPGCAFWLGFMKPQSETIIHYVSTGIPGHMQGEHYCESADALRQIQADIDPEPAPHPYFVARPMSLFNDAQRPDVVAFFARPESLSGLHQLAMFVTNDPQVVTSPWGAACTNLVTWPYKYLAKGQPKAVLGGWDPSARKFFNTDELTFTIPYGMYQQMLARYEDSFLTTPTWQTVKKKIARSNRVWARKKRRA